MLSLYGNGYTYISLRFLADSIGPPCAIFEVPFNRKKCKGCNMRVACRDLAHLIQLCEKVTAELPTTGKRIHSISDLDKNLTTHY